MYNFSAHVRYRRHTVPLDMSVFEDVLILWVYLLSKMYRSVCRVRVFCLPYLSASIERFGIKFICSLYRIGTEKNLGQREIST